MTNVKIQMTNQIQMIKCLNDSVKNPDQRSGPLLPSAGTAGLFAECGFSKESIKPVQFGDYALKSLWPFSLVHSTRDHHRAKDEVFWFFNVMPITFLGFGL